MPAVDEGAWLGYRTFERTEWAALRAATPLPLRAEVDGFRRRGVGFACGADRRAHGIDQHHHARAAAERTIVDAAVIAFGVIARIPAVQRQQATLAGTPDHAMRGELGDEFGEQADDVEAHLQKSASQSTVTTPASKSTERM